MGAERVLGGSSPRAAVEGEGHRETEKGDADAETVTVTDAETERATEKD